MVPLCQCAGVATSALECRPRIPCRTALQGRDDDTAALHLPHAPVPACSRPSSSWRCIRSSGRAFQHNPWLNGLILAILLFGIFFNIRRILRLKPEARWIEAFRTNAPGFSLQDAPRLLAPIAAVLGERQRRGRTALSTLSLRHLLDSISSRLDENRDIAGYLRNLLIFLGLLGTFWGLIEAIGAISGVIAGLTIGLGRLRRPCSTSSRPACWSRSRAWARRSAPRCSASPAR